jgi:hypothetical protein
VQQDVCLQEIKSDFHRWGMPKTEPSKKVHIVEGLRYNN